jgi:predicted cupin superfamily sugar epimerase
VDEPLESSRLLIARHGLKPHPEGGWYREVHRSEQQVSRADGARRSGLTVILFLLEAGRPSAWHRVHGADESWHFIGGAPLELLLRASGDHPTETRLLGSGLSHSGLSHPELQPLAVVPAGWWQAARSQGAWSLVSCCVGPGFDFQDFELDAARQLQS